jgi:hypothetical protein
MGLQKNRKRTEKKTVRHFKRLPLYSYMNKLTLIGLVFLLLPLTAAYSFTEIMYDPSGSDTGKEWVEIYGEALTDLYFVEDGGKHSLTLVFGTCLHDCISLVAQDADYLLAQYNFSSDVLVYDTTWSSLKNTGETVGLMDGDALVLSFSYAASAPSPLSLQFTSLWEALAPTPGTVYTVVPEEMPVHDIPEFGLVGVLLVLVGVFVARKRQ